MHFDRLFRGVEGLGLSLPKAVTAGYLDDQIEETVAANEALDICRVRLHVYKADDAAAFVIACFPLDEEAIVLNKKGLVVGIADGIVKTTRKDNNLKISNSVIYSQAPVVVSQNSWDDVLIVNEAGHITESGIANIFWIKEAVIYTPPLTEGCVEGVMRRYIIETLRKENIEVFELPLTKQLLLEAEEVFLTNAIRKIRWVANIEGVAYEHSTIDQLYELLFQGNI